MEFKYEKLRNYAKLINGFAYKSKDYKSSGIPVVKIKNIVPPKVDLIGCNYVSEEVFKETMNYALKKGDILISMTGSGINQMNSAVGKVGRVNFNDRALQNQRVGKFEIIDDSKYNYDFLYYYLSQRRILEHFVTNSTGSANQANISKSIIEGLYVPAIDIKIQEKISEILLSYDKKIETNNKIIANLEAQAQAIFKYYFVDFEPFADGKFIDSDLGPIPEGWEVVTVNMISNVRSGKRPINKTENTSVPIIGANGLTGYSEDYLYDDNVIVTGRVGTLGIVKRYYGKIWASDNTLVFTSKDYFEYLYFQLLQVNYISLNRGSTQPLISQKDIKNIKIVLPNKKVLFKFRNRINKIFEFQNILNEQNQTLAQTRDALLPKLMAGEIDLDDLGGTYD